MKHKFRCDGCNASYNREAHYLQHITKSHNPLCNAAWQEHRRKTNPIKGGKRVKAKFTKRIHTEDFTEDVFEDFIENALEDGVGTIPETKIDEVSDDSDDDSEQSLSETDVEETVSAPSVPSFHGPVVPEQMDDSAEDDADSMPPGGVPSTTHSAAGRAPQFVTLFPGRAGEVIADGAGPPSQGGYAQYGEAIGVATNPWAPFESKIDWDIAQWAKTRGPGSTAFNELLEIPGVVDALGLSYKNTPQLHSVIDELPPTRPEFFKHDIEINGEKSVLFSRDIMECVRALYSDPQHADYLKFAPERHYTDADKTERMYHDMHTGQWWWTAQKHIEAIQPGGTIIPIILSSDKTQITVFRNKSAYPVYMTIGNLPKSIRRKPSRQGQILVAYLPTSGLSHISNKAARRRTQTNIFHACMRKILEPLTSVGANGTELLDGHGNRRRCHPILAVYVGDYPEQVLVTATLTGDCPICQCPNDQLGDYSCTHEPRNLAHIYDALAHLGQPEYNRKCRNVRMKPVQSPFWEDLPFTNIFQSITPDILHQLLQGVVKHLLAWVTEACGDDVIDERVTRLPPNHSLRHFKKGITILSRLSGTEHKQICAFLLGLLVDAPLPEGMSNKPLIAATRSIMDFLYLAQYPVHTDATILCLEESLARFHENKWIFQTLGIRPFGFNIPKLHSMVHYARAIRMFGSTDNYNTETTERLHIDFAKDAYRATNRKDEFTQMTRWLERQEKVAHHSNFAEWRAFKLLQTSDASLPSPASSRWDPPDMAYELHHKMTKHATLKSVRIDALVSGDGYGATSFRRAITYFISQFQNPGQPRRVIESAALHIHIPFNAVPVFHRIKFWNQDFAEKTTLDSIHCYPAHRSAAGDAIAARFDTALISVNKPRLDGSVGSESAVKGTRVGQVRVVFSIPESAYPTLFPGMTAAPPKHLAYVEWFTRFLPRPEQPIGMYKVSRSYTGDERSASIIPVMLIQRSVHLLPKWGRDRTIIHTWSRENVLDHCPSFYVNNFKDRNTYFNVY